MPFDRRGAQMGGATRLVPFLNAQIQGLDVARRTATGERNVYKNYRELATPYLKGATGSPLSIAEKKALPLAAGMWVKMASAALIGVALAAWYRDDPEHEEFDDYMRNERGLSVATRRGRRWVINRFLREMVAAGDSPTILTIRDVDAFRAGQPIEPLRGGIRAALEERRARVEVLP